VSHLAAILGARSLPMTVAGISTISGLSVSIISVKREVKISVLQECADMMGAVVGASRGAVDKGYIAKDHQVGQTGKTVKPKVYIACGISGAVQHLAGMEKSDYIIAINKDPEAAIFGVANIGLVGDALEILPLLTQEIKRYRERPY